MNFSSDTPAMHRLLIERQQLGEELARLRAQRDELDRGQNRYSF